MRLQNQVAIVTGSTSGLGEAIAIRFAREGTKVVIVGRNADRAGEVCKTIEAEGGSAFFVKADVTSETDVKNIVEKTVERFGTIDILVNNAGMVIPGAVVDLSLEQWSTTFEVNVTSAYLVSHYALPIMLDKRKGSIIHISSEAGLKGFKNRSAYCAAKASLVGLTKAMAVDHSPFGIRVNCICPGTIETPMVKQLIENHENPVGMKQEFLQRRLTPELGSPAEIAEAAVYFALPENTYVTGSILAIDGGATAK
jgi:NAD(P)-dependent dehydrogenase (short-subunit alcohol dehydrogenase family)